MDHPPTTPEIPAPLVYSLAEAARLLCVGESTVKELCRRGELAHIDIGRRRLIPREALAAFVAARVADTVSKRLKRPVALDRRRTA